MNQITDNREGQPLDSTTTSKTVAFVRPRPCYLLAGVLIALTLTIPNRGTAAEPVKVSAAEATGAETGPFAERGYYMILSRMPTFGLEAWTEILDCMAEDRANLLILWIGGAFRSERFPVTWEYNREHANVREDFVRDLIRQAHRRQIRVLLGFTPFGYDGVNQYPKEHPELKAIGKDGRPVGEFGIHCWGWNLCPGREASQQFMLDYARELAFDFYPEADGLFLESSDYAVCHHCGAKHFEHEYAFVRKISDELWQQRPEAKIIVYPHYFSGARMPFAEAEGTRQAFDPRWTLFFTPHSAHLDKRLIEQATSSLYWSEAPAWFHIERIREGARAARDAGCTGYVPSLECYSFIPTHPEDGQPWLVGQRQVPFGFGWLKPGESPYRELPVRVSRLACREFWRDPDLPWETFRQRLGQELFGEEATPQQIDDALELTRIFGTERNWSTPSPLSSPWLVEARSKAGQLTAEQKTLYRTQLDTARDIASRYKTPTSPGATEMKRIAQWLVDQWSGDAASLLQ